MSRRDIDILGVGEITHLCHSAGNSGLLSGSVRTEELICDEVPFAHIACFLLCLSGNGLRRGSCLNGNGLYRYRSNRLGSVLSCGFKCSRDVIDNGSCGNAFLSDVYDVRIVVVHTCLSGLLAGDNFYLLILWVLDREHIKEIVIGYAWSGSCLRSRSSGLYRRRSIYVSCCDSC